MMVPYKDASDELINRDENINNTFKGAAKTALSLATGGALLPKVLPLLSKYIPTDLAIKGLSKIDGRFGKFFRGMETLGKSKEDAMDFVRDKVNKDPELDKKQESLDKFNKRKKNSMTNTTDENEIYNRLYKSANELEPKKEEEVKTEGQGTQALMAILQKINEKLGM